MGNREAVQVVQFMDRGVGWDGWLLFFFTFFKIATRLVVTRQTFSPFPFLHSPKLYEGTFTPTSKPSMVVPTNGIQIHALVSQWLSIFFLILFYSFSIENCSEWKIFTALGYTEMSFESFVNISRQCMANYQKEANGQGRSVEKQPTTVSLRQQLIYINSRHSIIRK